MIIILAEGFVGVIGALRPSCWPSYFEAVVPGGRAGVMVKWLGCQASDREHENLLLNVLIRAHLPLSSSR